MPGASGPRPPGAGGAVRRWRTRRRLVATFERPGATPERTLPIRRTGRGIWVATPIRVLEAAVAILSADGLLGGPGGADAANGHVIDAGSGDGRVLAVMAWLVPGQPVLGVESDEVLHVRAANHLRVLGAGGVIDPAHLHLAAADYCDPATYAVRGIALARAPLVLNYPDGNQDRLARFVAAHCGPRTTLGLLTHDPELTVDALPLRARHDVRARRAGPWRLSLYRRSG